MVRSEGELRPEVRLVAGGHQAYLLKKEDESF
jgi:hypothetical protein